MREAQATYLASMAERVLRRNDMGGWTRAAPNLYPHQWSWDTGFIAIGLAHLDTPRAAPPDSCFPGPEHWSGAGLYPEAPPAPPYTSCLCQPPTHALGALRVWELAQERDQADAARGFLSEIYPKLLAWHRYLATERDPEGSGLVTINHPWESGTDNSPRWDGALQNIEVGDLPPFERQDLDDVDHPTERPTDEEYARYLWLVELIKRVRCDEAEIYVSHPFLVKDVLFSAILVAANETLLEIAGVVGAPEKDMALIEAWISRGRAGLEEQWNPELGLCVDHDLRRDAPLKARTVGGFAPLVAGGEAPGRLDALLRTLYSTAFLGNPKLRRPLPPSTSPTEAHFQPRNYWRGPVWPVISWLLWRSLVRAGERDRAYDLRRVALQGLSGGNFAEYYEPFTGEPLGSDDQSWTAAVTLDWLSYDDGAS